MINYHVLQTDNITSWLRDYEPRAESAYNRLILAQWDYETNLTTYNQEVQVSNKFAKLNVICLW